MRVLPGDRASLRMRIRALVVEGQPGDKRFRGACITWGAAQEKPKFDAAETPERTSTRKQTASLSS